MKILFVQKEGGIFGAENYQLKVIPGLMAKGVEVEFLRLYTDYQGGKGGVFIERLNALGVKTFEVNIGKYPTPRVLKKIKKIANDGNYDIVHTHLIHADLHLALIKTFMKLEPALVSTKHGYDNTFTSKFGFDASKQSSTPYFLISKWAEKRMCASFTISNGLRNFFIATGLTKPEKMRLIHYGFDMPDNYLYKGKKEFKKASKQVIIAGRLVAFKGHTFLIEAMKMVVRVFGSEVKLLIAGTGALEATLKEQVEILGLSEHIDFLGYSTEVGALMANSDAVVVPSISEGFGVVFLEAFSAKTPVIAWDVPAGNELMEHGKTGYLVQPYDVTSLGQQIISVLNDPGGQTSVTEAAYEKLKSYFNLERMVDETISFYKDALS
ncbi:glycosyltransferase family 4 protein [Roseivirga thermotolerans]|uniref:glycosyltransferase family 4 protein n=1 Tax=Roseivirga thermotolerans TaxID=1758176 RepID=UPI00273E8AF4|nr:glycosyltransferase family 4 protein [Roseivirga thermotolerans]